MRRLWCALGCVAGLTVAAAGCGEEESAPAGGGGGDAKAFVSTLDAVIERCARWLTSPTANTTATSLTAS